MFLPGYGTLPLVTSSVSSIPKDQTSDLMVKRPYRAASGAVHLMGNFAPGKRESSQAGGNGLKNITTETSCSNKATIRTKRTVLTLEMNCIN